MVAAVFAAFEGIKTNLSAFGSLELHPRKGFHRTGIDANPTFATRFVKSRPCFQGCVRQHRDKSGPGSELVGQQ